MERPAGSTVVRAMARTVAPALGAAIALATSSAVAQEILFNSTQLTQKNEYTTRIEGPAVNAAGDLFVANIRIPGAADPDRKGGGIGVMKSGTTQSELFGQPLPDDGIGNGIRFDLQGRMYVADLPRRSGILRRLPIRMIPRGRPSPGPTTSRSRVTARCTPAIPISARAPAASGELQEGRMAGPSARS
jgi:hypothetical protein